MIKKKVNTEIQDILREKVTNYSEVSGGSISETYCIECESGASYFLKIAPTELLRAEAMGLFEIQKSQTIATPQIVAEGDQFLILEYIGESASQSIFWLRLGKELAEMHKTTSSSFGYLENNFIGTSRQVDQPLVPFNDSSSDWIDFYWTYRLLFQYKELEKNGLLNQEFKKSFSKLEKSIDKILAHSEEPPSLLHGDLWNGNILCGPSSTPFLIDPAVYYGHRESDIAMTQLFGSFPIEFYESYMEAFPLPPGWQNRMGIYQLYHLMNHWNMFGQSYATSSQRCVDSYI